MGTRKLAGITLPRPSAGISVLIVFLMILSATLGWAAATLLFPPHTDDAPPRYAVTTASHGTLGRDLRLSVKAQWTQTDTLAGKTAGTLTSIPNGRHGKIRAGDVLYTVDLNPVYVMPGTVPAFRDLTPGTSGKDVEQLQEYLFAEYQWGIEADGNFGSVTERAVKIWQKDHGQEETGTIPAGQILFTPTLPMMHSWKDEIRIGSELQSGTALISIYGNTPTFIMPLPEGQLRATSEGQAVTLEYDGHTWQAIIGKISENPEERILEATLQPIPGNATICGEYCDTIPAEGLKGINATVVLVAEESGTQIPITAIRVNNEGQTVIIDADGQQIPITVRTTVGGQAIVDGIEPGQSIRIWGSQEENPNMQQPQNPANTPESGR